MCQCLFAKANRPSKAMNLTAIIQQLKAGIVITSTCLCRDAGWLQDEDANNVLLLLAEARFSSSMQGGCILWWWNREKKTHATCRRLGRFSHHCLCRRSSLGLLRWLRFRNRNDRSLGFLIRLGWASTIQHSIPVHYLIKANSSALRDILVDLCHAAATASGPLRPEIVCLLRGGIDPFLAAVAPASDVALFCGRLSLAAHHPLLGSRHWPQLKHWRWLRYRGPLAACFEKVPQS